MQTQDERLLSGKPVVSSSPEETRRLAGRLMCHLPACASLALHGELGSGKTCFVQGLALALEIDQPVTSPTFTIINQYKGLRPLYHVDLFRLSGLEELLALGFEEVLEADGVIAIEWAERAGDMLPQGTTHVTLESRPNPEERSITVQIARDGK